MDITGHTARGVIVVHPKAADDALTQLAKSAVNPQAAGSDCKAASDPVGSRPAVPDR